jgi:beta-glucuronidase
MSDLFGVICLNRHYGWYVDTGEAVTALREWVRLHGEPITEYGADALIPDRLSSAPDRP